MPDRHPQPRPRRPRAARRQRRAPAVRHGFNRRDADILETQIETYNLLIGAPRAAPGEVSSAVQNVEGAFTAIGELLEDGLDGLMLPFRPGDLYNEYESARVIVDPAGSGSGARKKMKDAADKSGAE